MTIVHYYSKIVFGLKVAGYLHTKGPASQRVLEIESKFIGKSLVVLQLATSQKRT